MKVNKILFATSNEGKLREVRMILAELGLPVYSLKEYGIHSDPEENGETFEANAEIKVRDVLGRPETADCVVMADDSGLCIDCFGGDPGVHSARYLGHDTSYDYKNQVILEKMAQVKREDRGARYVCAISAGFPDGSVYTVRGVMEGYIGYEPKGTGGFGYDPIFVVEGEEKTAAERDPDVKNSLSHRGKALEAMKAIMKKVL